MSEIRVGPASITVFYYIACPVQPSCSLVMWHRNYHDNSVRGARAGRAGGEERGEEGEP